MTEREPIHENLFDEGDGLLTGEPNLEDLADVSDYLSPEELEGIKHVAEELQTVAEQGSDTMPADLIMPDEPEPPVFSADMQADERG